MEALQESSERHHSPDPLSLSLSLESKNKTHAKQKRGTHRPLYCTKRGKLCGLHILGYNENTQGAVTIEF